MAVLFPSTLPVWQAAGHTLEQADCYAPPVRRAVGLSRRRRVSRSAPQTVTASLLLTAEQMATFAAWYEADLVAGAQPFTTRVMGLGATLATHDALFVEPYRYTPQATARGVVYRVEATLRCTPPGLVTVPPTEWTPFVYSAVPPPSTDAGMFFVRWVDMPDFNGFLASGSSLNRHLRSVDGINWTAHSWTGPISYLYHYEALSTGTAAFINFGGGLMRATAIDGAWVHVTGSAGVSGCNRAKAANGVLIYCSANGGIGRSEDDGLTWSLRFTFPDGSSQAVTDAVFHNGRWLACGFAGALATSDDNGLSWTQRPVVGAPPGNGTISRLWSVSGRLLAHIVGYGLLESVNGGNSWSTLHDFSSVGQPYRGWLSTINDMQEADGTIVMVGTPTTAQAVYSRDNLATLERVTVQPSATFALQCVTHGAGRWVACAFNEAGRRFWSAPSLATPT